MFGRYEALLQYQVPVYASLSHCVKYILAVITYKLYLTFVTDLYFKVISLK